MWQPEPGWQRLAAGLGSSTAGVWLAGDRVVKRLTAPLPGDPAELSDPEHFAWWRRPAEVALSGAVEATPGLRGAHVLGVDEDAEGITLWFEHLDEKAPSGLFVARSIGRFAGAELASYPWLARHQLASRIARVERGGGWPTLARTTVADVTEFLWQRRRHFLDAVAQLPQVPQHGDPTPANLFSHDGESVIAIDWATLGFGPVGADLGYYALGAREEFEPLIDAYVDALPPALATREQVELGAQVSAVYTVISRAEWALARVTEGQGALAGKFRHPSVAPYLRSLQRQFPQIEALVGQ
ncbi:MAG TPA: phosphotransferase [Kribbellaceae bacterium]|nr:phosphotransferase [Kribbellaceae bacterium]